MWKSLLTFTVAALLATPVFAQAEGKWIGKIPDNMRPIGESALPQSPNARTITAEFKVDGFKLTGTMTFGDGQPIEITDGSMIASQVSFLTTRNGVTERSIGDVKGDEIALRRDVVAPPRQPDAPTTPATLTPMVRSLPIILKRVQ